MKFNKSILKKVLSEALQEMGQNSDHPSWADYADEDWPFRSISHVAMELEYLIKNTEQGIKRNGLSEELIKKFLGRLTGLKADLDEIVMSGPEKEFGNI